MSGPIGLKRFLTNFPAGWKRAILLKILSAILGLAQIMPQNMNNFIHVGTITALLKRPDNKIVFEKSLFAEMRKQNEQPCSASSSWASGAWSNILGDLWRERNPPFPLLTYYFV
jgi:hypothetical protein